jgi:hypothetical protein
VEEGAGSLGRVNAASEESLRDERRQVEVREGGGDFYGRRIDPSGHMAEIVPLVSIIFKRLEIIESENFNDKLRP